jgi:hypothetical protein
MAMVPESWNPSVTGTPSGGKAASAMRDIIHSVKGELQEVFVIRVSNRGPENAGRDQPPQERTARTDGGFGGPRGPGQDGGGRGNFHPEWMAERAQARIAQLPAAEQGQAKKDFDEMRAFFEKMRALPDDQRRAAMDQFFNNPVVQERMAERMATRDEKSGPDRRTERARQYIQRKAQMKSQPSS